MAELLTLTPGLAPGVDPTLDFESILKASRAISGEIDLNGLVVNLLKLAMENGKFPVAILDSGDNVGGGSPGDSTFLLKELLRQKAQGWVVTIADRPAAEALPDGKPIAEVLRQVSPRRSSTHDP